MRGDIWTIVGSGYASKPRPAIVIQSELTDVFDSVVVCLLTSDDSVESVTRVPILPSKQNGLKKSCYIMADKIVTLKKSSLGTKIGTLEAGDVAKMNSALMATLGL